MWKIISSRFRSQIAPGDWNCAEAESKCISEYQLNGRWRFVSTFAKGLASHLFIGVPMFPFSVPLIRRSKKCYPAQLTQTFRALRSRSTRSRPEHENNEPALGVAKLVDERTQARGKLKGRRGKQGTVDALCVSQVAKPRKRNRHVGCFATNVSSACRSRSLHTRCPPSKWGRISGRWGRDDDFIRMLQPPRCGSVKQIYEQRTKLCSRIMGSALHDKDTLVYGWVIFALE